MTIYTVIYFVFMAFATWKDRWKTLDFNITCEEVIEKGLCQSIL